MKKNKISLLILAFLLLPLISVVSADIGPHNAVQLSFQVTYNNQSISDNFQADILACRNNECTDDASTICVNGICEFNYYRVERVPSKIQLLVKLNNEEFTSDIINFSSNQPILFYDIDIGADDKVRVTPSDKEESSDPSLWIALILALALTIILELIVLVIFLKKWKIKSKQWLKPIITIIVADIISVPLVWVVFVFFLIMFSMISVTMGMLLSILIAEVLAVVFEAFFIYWLNKKIITLKKSFILSLVMNLASFLIGGIIFTILLSQL